MPWVRSSRSSCSSKRHSLPNCCKRLASHPYRPTWWIHEAWAVHRPLLDRKKEWREWKGKVTAYLYATAPFAKPYLDWAETCMTAINQTVMEAQCIDGAGDVSMEQFNTMAQFSTRLGLILIDTCKGEPYRIVESAGHGNGLEAWRLLMRRYASRTPGTKRALLASLFSMKPATSAADLESVLLTVEEVIRRYDAMSVDKMPEDIQCAILIAVCPKELK